MARGKLSGDEKAKKRALGLVKRESDAVRKAEASSDERRRKRNEAIVDAAKHAPATEIAAAAGIKQSYVSRVIRSRGKPESGSDLDRRRDGEPANA